MDTMTIRSMYPRLVVSDAAGAIEFYTAAFGAKEVERHTDPATGKIVHAAVTLGDILIAVKDEDGGDPAPSSLGGSPVIMALEVATPTPSVPRWSAPAPPSSTPSVTRTTASAVAASPTPTATSG